MSEIPVTELKSLLDTQPGTAWHEPGVKAVLRNTLDGISALRAENERLALSLVDAEDRLAAALDDRAFLLELLGITVKTGTKDPLLDARLAEARAFLAGGKTK